MINSPRIDPELSDLLRAWQVEPDVDPHLAAKVWRRIDSPGQEGGFQSWLDQWSRMLVRPVVASVAIAACALLGFVAAEVRHHSDREQVLARVAGEYVRTIDPVIMTGLPAENHGP